MSSEAVPSLPAWDRPFFQPGGPSASLDYIVLGRFVQPIEISMTAYATAGVPDFVDVTIHTRAEEPALFDDIPTSPAGQWLRANDATLYSRLKLCEEMVRLSGAVPDPPSLNYLRDTIGIIQALMDQGGAALLDKQAGRWWRPDQWKEQVWAKKALDVGALIGATATRDEGENGASWTVRTRGMRLFGRPDIQIRSTPENQVDAAVRGVHAMARSLAQGRIIAEGARLRTSSLNGQLVCHIVDAFDDLLVGNDVIDIVFPASA